MDAAIQKWGNSCAVRLPKIILDTARLRENEAVRILAEPDKIVIEKADNFKHKSLKKRLAGFDGEYVFEEWDTGSAVGSEVF